MKKETYSKIFVFLCAVNITCLLISNIVTIKTIKIFGILLTAGTVLFPITYILNDVFTEVYGFKKAKFVTWLSFICNLFMVIIFKITIMLPVNEGFEMQRELEMVLGSTPRLLIASFVSFLVGTFTNSIIMSKMKVKTNGKFLALRTIGSTIIGEGADTLVFVPIAFAGILSFQDMFFLFLNGYLLKVLLEVVLTPVTYKVVAFIKDKEKIDTFDNEQKYSIF